MKKLLLLCCLLGLAPVATAQSVAPEKVKDFFPVSVWYAGGKARAPMLEEVTAESHARWGRDLDQIKALGFNTVRCWVEWAAVERREGEYDFSALELLVHLAAERGLKVITQFYIDSAPEWAGQKFPDAKFVASNGLAVESQNAPGFCFDHSGVQERVLRFFAEAARRMKNKAAFYGWDLWSEPHVINWAEIQHIGNLEFVQFCYCRSSVARFRRWLEKKYSRVEALNAAWYRTYQKWSDVQPPRFGTILSYTDYIDWKNYLTDKLAEDLALKAGAVRSMTPNAIVTSHAEIPGLMSRPRWDGTPDDRKMAESVDYYGASIYPKHAGARVPWSPLRRAVGFDFTRSMNFKHGGFYIGELQAGYGVFGMRLGLPVTAADLRDWMWSAVATGAKAINIYAYYPMSSGYESGGYGLIELDGKVTERAQAAGAVAKTITQHKNFFLEARPVRAQIAILYNPLSHFVGGQQTFTAGGQTIGANNLSESLQGVYRAYYENNIPVDFVHLMDASAAHLSQYKLVIAPYPVLMPKSTIKELIEYVRAGGTLVAEARAGWNDERGFAADVIPGGGLHEVFGCREAATTPIDRQSRITIKDAHAALPFLKAGETLDALFFEESLNVISDRAQTLAAFADGKPAMVYSTFGRGQALMIGSFIGSAYYHFSNAANARFFTGLAAWLKIEPAVPVTSSADNAFVEVRVLERRVGSNRERVLMCFNRSERETNVRLTFESTEQASVSDLETGARVVSQRLAGGQRQFERTLKPQEVWIIKVDEK